MPRMQTGEPSSEHLRRMEKKREFEERIERFKLEAEKRKELEKQALANEGAMGQQELVSKTALEERRLAEKGSLARQLAASPLDVANIDLLKSQKEASKFTLDRLRSEAAAEREKTRSILGESLKAATINEPLFRGRGVKREEEKKKEEESSLLSTFTEDVLRKHKKKPLFEASRYLGW